MHSPDGANSGGRPRPARSLCQILEFVRKPLKYIEKTLVGEKITDPEKCLP
jgi:hypothetical protein